MPEQSSALPAAAEYPNLSRADALRDEEVALLRKLALTKKRWWQEPAVLIAALAFLLSLATSIISIWTGHLKDIHDQQAELAKLSQDMQNLVVKVPEIRQQYKNSPGDLPGILTLIAQQERSLRQDAVAVALGLGTNAPSGELINLAQGSLGVGNVLEAKQLLTLAVSAAASALDRSFALRLLGALQIQVIGSPDMRSAGNANFERAVNIQTEYPDLQDAPAVELYIKVITEMAWATALTPTACSEARLHVRRDQNYLYEAPVAVRSNAERALANNSVVFPGGTVLLPSGCSVSPNRWTRH